MVIITLGGLAACGPTYFAAAADAEVGRMLAQSTTEVLGDRADRVLQAEPNQPDPEAEAEGAEPEPAPMEIEAGAMDLDAAMRTGFVSNRDFLSQRENLTLQGLNTNLARFDFGPQLAASINPFWSKFEAGPDQSDIDGTLRASQILPLGGTVALTGTLGAMDWRRSFGVQIDQPLLRGFGYTVSHERLTQAERNLVYEIRSFELFRQDFSILLARRFFDLVSQQRTLVNEEANWQQAKFDREKDEALFRVERNREEDVFRARRREIETEDALIDAKVQFRRAVDNFKILLGLPTSTPIEIADQTPPFEPVDIDLDSAVRAARHNRLDLITQRQQVEDAERNVRNVANGLLPDLNLQVAADRDDPLGDDGPGFWSASASLDLEIPLQRTPERNAYRAAQISAERSRRAYTLALDQLELDIRDQLRQLASAEQRIALQREQIEQQKRAVAITQFKYEQGDAQNRDLLEARQSLVDAQNLLIQLQADHFVRRLQLLRDLGLLFVNEDGTWQ
ncbi:MAG: TolC family protein [Planctomycetota bacterium]